MKKGFRLLDQAILIFLFAGFIVFNWSIAVFAQSSTQSGEIMKAGASARLKTANVAFTTEKVYEVVLSSLKPGKQQQFFSGYLPKVMPLVSEYGGKFLAVFPVIKKHQGNIHPQTIAILEWPDVESFRRICRDQRLLDIIGIRNDSLEYINEANFFKVKANTSVQFRSDRVYEFSAIWQNSTSKEKFGEIIDKIADSEKAQGRYPILDLYPLPVPDGAYHPGIIRFIGWNSADDFVRMRNGIDYDRLLKANNTVVQRQDTLLTGFLFN